MKVARILLIAHLLALVFGLAGLLVAIPHPEWWSGDPKAVRVFTFGMRFGGATHILFGAAAVFVFAWVTLGPRRTATFFVVSTGLSLTSELIGTGTGWPFGNYAYTSFLGYKVLGRVPFTIPLSWFYLGLVAYILGSLLASRLPGSRTAWSLAWGVWLLTAWDLVLDPAMAAHNLPVQFWVWHETGPYFGMPILNLAGWSLTGLGYMGISRLLWGSDIEVTRVAPSATFPYLVYCANLAFAIVLSLSAGLWPPVVLALFAGFVPTTVAVGSIRRRGALPPLGQQRWRTSPTR